MPRPKPQAAAFPGHSGKHILQDERKMGLRDWLCRPCPEGTLGAYPGREQSLGTPLMGSAQQAASCIPAGVQLVTEAWHPSVRQSERQYLCGKTSPLVYIVQVQGANLHSPFWLYNFLFCFFKYKTGSPLCRISLSHLYSTKIILLRLSSSRSTL